MADLVRKEMIAVVAHSGGLWGLSLAAAALAEREPARRPRRASCSTTSIA